MSKINQNFLKAIKRSFIAYNKKGGARSNKKLIPIHKFLSESISGKLGKDFVIKSLGVGDGREEKFDGKYYPKNLDIAVLKDDEVVATISFKFVTSNYKQNSNNYFENLMGETANIRRCGIGFAHFLVLRGHTPYFEKNKGNLRGKKKKTEVLNDKDLKKYIKLFKDVDFPHKPDLTGICVVDFDENNNPKFPSLDEFGLSEETKELLKDDFSLNTFLKKFVSLVDLKS